MALTNKTLMVAYWDGRREDDGVTIVAGDGELLEKLKELYNSGELPNEEEESVRKLLVRHGVKFNKSTGAAL